MNDAIIANFQLAFFFKEKLASPELIGAGFPKSDLGKRWGGKVPTFQSLPDNPQFDNAAIVSAEMDGNRLTISRARADIIIDGKKQKLSERMEFAHQNFKEFFSFITAESPDLIVNRTGYVSRFFFSDQKESDNIVNILKYKPMDIQGGTKNHSGSYRSVTIDAIDNMEIHNLTMIESVEVNFPDSTKQKGIMLTRDFNVVPGKDYVLNWEKVNKFIETAEAKYQLDRILPIIWPHE